jgi:serine/threonine protein kinase
MNMKPSAKTRTDFVSGARRLALLDEEAAGHLLEESRRADVSPADLALQQGLLDAVQIDIVETLQHPHDVVPGYEILGLLGKGGMGVVFRARQKSLDRIVAVKTILVKQTHHPTSIARFEQEARAVARLRHPNIVAAFDLGRHEGRLYFVMELVNGEDVERMIERQGPLGETVAWGLLRQAAAGLSHAASAGIVHRDIKPANLLLVEPPAGLEIPSGLTMVKIADFGLAFLTQDVEAKTRLTSVNTVMGSPYYLAPEQLASESFDHRVDIYSLGATAYHLLTGEPPFREKTLSQIFARKLAADSLDLLGNVPHVSPASAELVRRMTRRDPGCRIAGYTELLSEIDSVLSASRKRVAPVRLFSMFESTQFIPSVPTPDQLAVPAIVTRPNRPRRATHRGFLMLMGSGALCVCAVAVGAWSFWSTRAQKPLGRLVPTGLTINLFDRRSLNDWHYGAGGGWPLTRNTRSGVSMGWAVKSNAEGQRVLSGTSASLRQALVKKVGQNKTALEHFRLSTVIQLRGATAAEIEFGIDTSLGDYGSRYVARLTNEGVSAGQRNDAYASYARLTDVKPLPSAPAGPYTLTVERQTEFWEIWLNQISVGVLPLSMQRQASMFSLRAEGGEVWVSDVTVQELAPPRAER